MENCCRFVVTTPLTAFVVHFCWSFSANVAREKRKKQPLRHYHVISMVCTLIDSNSQPISALEIAQFLQKEKRSYSQYWDNVNTRMASGYVYSRVNRRKGLFLFETALMWTAVFSLMKIICLIVGNTSAPNPNTVWLQLHNGHLGGRRKWPL